MGDKDSISSTGTKFLSGLGVNRNVSPSCWGEMGIHSWENREFHGKVVGVSWESSGSFMGKVVGVSWKSSGNLMGK